MCASAHVGSLTLRRHPDADSQHIDADSLVVVSLRGFREWKEGGGGWGGGGADRYSALKTCTDSIHISLCCVHTQAYTRTRTRTSARAHSRMRACTHACTHLSERSFPENYVRDVVLQICVLPGAEARFKQQGIKQSKYSGKTLILASSHRMDKTHGEGRVDSSWRESKEEAGRDEGGMEKGR